MRRSYVGEVSVYRSNAYQGLRFADVQNCAPRAELRARARAYVGEEDEDCIPAASSAPERTWRKVNKVSTLPLPVSLQESLTSPHVQLVIQAPQGVPKGGRPRCRTRSALSLIFEENRFPEPLVVDLCYVDIRDASFAEALWKSGLGWLLRTDGRVSKYSLRIFLNGSTDKHFEGGLSVFHVPFQDPVVFEPMTGLALLYPQGELCTPQEEAEVTFGTKYVLRADVRISPISTSDLETADRCVTEVKVFCDADGDSTDLLVAIAHGVQLSCAVLRISDDGHLETSRSRREKSTRHEAEHVSWLMASTPCHGLPIVSLLCDTTGVLAASDPMLGSSFVSRANVLTLDSSGYAVIWQLEEAEAQEGSCRGLFLRPSRFCSLVAKSMQNYLTAAEQAAICMETRMVRTAARERELLQDKKLFSGFALSPSHCMLVTQTVLPSTRTTQIRPVTFLLASSLGSPAHAFTALLRNVGDSLYRRRCRRESVSTGRAARRPSRPEGMEQTQSETCDNGDHIHHRRRKAAGGSSYPLYLSLWDVSEAWRSMVFGAGKSLGAMCRASWDEKKPCEGSELPNGLLESILQWLWELQEGLQGAFQHISDSAASSATGSAAGCKVSLLLRHTAAQQVTFTLSSPKSFTERWASEASPRRRHFLAQIRHELNELALKTWTSDTELNAAKGGQSSFAGVEEDELAMCQVCNALLELGHKATRDLRRKYLLAELPPKNPVVRAAACAYWRQRAKALPGSVVRSAVLDCLAKVEDSLKEAELESTSCGSCRLCGEPAVIDPSFMQVQSLANWARPLFQEIDCLSRSRNLSVSNADVEASQVAVQSLIVETSQAFQSEMDKVGVQEPKMFRTLTHQERKMRKRASQVELPQELDLEDQYSLCDSPTESVSLRRPTVSAKRSEGPGGWRKNLRRVVLSLPFETFFAFCILSNAVFLGVEVEYYVHNPGPMPFAIELVGQLYNLAFLVEIVLRMVALGSTFFTGETWAWNWMDLLIVFSAIAETVVQVTLSLIHSDTWHTAGWHGTGFIKALRTLVSSIVFTLKSLVWALVLLILIIYGFGIVFTQAAAMFLESHSSEGPHLCLGEQRDLQGISASTLDGICLYWNDLSSSMLTLFMSLGTLVCLSICGGLSWEAALRPMLEVSHLYASLLLFYIAFSYFAVLNVVTGVFCQSAIESAQSDHEMIMQNIIANKEAHIRKVKSLFCNLDADDSGYISLKELEENIDKKSVTTYFEALELDVHDAATSERPASQECPAVVRGLRLRGPARALDLAKMAQQQSWMAQQMGAFMGHVEVSLKKLEVGIVKLCEVQLEMSAVGSGGILTGSGLLSPSSKGSNSREVRDPSGKAVHFEREVETGGVKAASPDGTAQEAEKDMDVTPGHVTHVNNILPAPAVQAERTAVLLCESRPEQL
eukprot:g5176.t1